MKKNILIPVATVLAASTILFASCGEVTTSFSSGWYSNTGITSSISDTNETLTYAVSFTKGSNIDVTVSYENGSYTTQLINSIYTYSDNTKVNAYVYTTSFAIDATYTIAGKSETYHDTIETKAIFLTSDNSLKPVYSERTVNAHTLINSAPISLETDIADYSYTIQTEYDKELTKATMTYTDLKKNDKTVSTIKINDKYSYLDNEELLFAIRGMSLGASASETVNVLNTARKKVQAINIANEAVATLTPEFTINGEKVNDTVKYNQITLSVSDTQSGVPQTLYYAATVDQNSNTYRNVMILNHSVLPYNLGMLTYSLVNANFTNK